MAVSVRLDPLLEKELELAAKRLGVSKSQFIVTALEQALGRKNPYELYLSVQEATPGYALGTDTAQAARLAAAAAGAAGTGSTSDTIRQMLQQRHQAESQDWLLRKGAGGAEEGAA